MRRRARREIHCVQFFSYYYYYYYYFLYTFTLHCVNWSVDLCSRSGNILCNTVEVWYNEDSDVTNELWRTRSIFREIYWIYRYLKYVPRGKNIDFLEKSYKILKILILSLLWPQVIKFERFSHGLRIFCFGTRTECSYTQVFDSRKVFLEAYN